MDLTVILVIIAIGSLGAAVVYGTSRWEASTRKLRARLEAGALPVAPAIVDFRELKGLPVPVQRYFRTVLKEGQPMVSGVLMRHRGTFNMGETADRWKPFSSDQQVITRRPGFHWDGKIAITPGFPARVYDAYIGGEGILHAALLGLFTVADLRGTHEIAEGELMRFFAEAAWYPTALLPSQGVRWEPVDERSAQATLFDGTAAPTLLFRFNDAGVIETVHAEARGRTLRNQVVPTPWQGHFWNYRERKGMRVPLNSEGAWLLPEGAKPYWRGHITNITYNFAG
ncbi:DUF6920 family protein [Microbulbifer rhizosphaerae]|uniref:Uncharacterized protein n=1 Tax=Microbulbifer rhizosphaerae TaxID=1562603 RepID=A0A7W4WF92_9GAMM|nr:DUF6544 family protein [Microbulbifer rhizosphaerae]MBB3063114.1 hypothetical protein [Microbulbifer rhizosphaerae]